MAQITDSDDDFDFDFGDEDSADAAPSEVKPSAFDFTGEAPVSAPKAPPPPPKSAKPAKPPVAPANPAKSEPLKAAALAADVPVQVVAVMGKKTLTVQELVSLKKGQVLELNRFPNEAIDLVANGKLMAKGELVEIEGKLGVRIIKIFD